MIDDDKMMMIRSHFYLEKYRPLRYCASSKNLSHDGVGVTMLLKR